MNCAKVFVSHSEHSFHIVANLCAPQTQICILNLCSSFKHSPRLVVGSIPTALLVSVFYQNRTLCFRIAVCKQSRNSSPTTGTHSYFIGHSMWQMDGWHWPVKDPHAIAADRIIFCPLIDSRLSIYLLPDRAYGACESACSTTT